MPLSFLGRTVGVLPHILLKGFSVSRLYKQIKTKTPALILCVT